MGICDVNCGSLNGTVMVWNVTLVSSYPSYDVDNIDVDLNKINVIHVQVANNRSIDFSSKDDSYCTRTTNVKGKAETTAPNGINFEANSMAYSEVFHSAPDVQDTKGFSPKVWVEDPV